jgi:hypothetical protein
MAFESYTARFGIFVMRAFIWIGGLTIFSIRVPS